LPVLQVEKQDMIISLVNQKGGVGKTTAAINLASGLAEMGNQTLDVESDPQGSVIQWQSIASEKEFDTVHLPNPKPLQGNRLRRKEDILWLKGER
jgi:chromosome partitioning protein